MSPPGREALTASHGLESSDWPDAREADQEESFDLREGILALFPITHNDPTGQMALRKIQKQLGYFEPDAEVFLQIKSKSRGNINIRIDFELKSMIAELIDRAGEVTPTQSRSGYRARIKKKTPEAVEFGDESSNEGSTENTPTERGIFNV